MRRHVWVSVAALIAAAAGSGRAEAGDKVLYEPIPNWVEDAGKLSETEMKAEGLILLDEQQKADEAGLTTYVDIAVHANSTQELAAAGTISMEWFPDKGDLVIHRVQLLRDGQFVDIANGGKSFAVLHREKALEAQILDGRLTATMQVEGLKVGDVLRYSYSIRFKDPVLGGNVEAGAPLPAAPFKLARGRYRLLWSKNLPMRWRVSAKDMHPAIAAHGDYEAISLNLPLPKPPDRPPMAPLRFSQPSLIEASSFAKWEDVSAAEAKVVPERGLIADGSPLAARVGAIAAKSPDPLVRAAEAVRMVQDEIRYFETGQAEGNLVPQAPMATWEKRYGDCKAKSLLLTAVLRALGIEAVPALAHASQGDLLPSRLPSFTAFNHMIVRAVIGGKVYWLDGTLSGTRLPDLADTPPYHYALPVKPGGAGLEAIDYRPPARPLLQIDNDIDSSATIALPSPVDIRIDIGGPGVATLKNLKNQLDGKKFNASLDIFIRGIDPGIGLIGRRDVAFNDDEGRALITARGLFTTIWKKVGDRTTYQVGAPFNGVNLRVDRARPEWKDAPVEVPLPVRATSRIRLHLPSVPTGFQIENSKTLDEHFAGRQVAYKTSLTAQVFELDQSMVGDQYEMPADQLQAAQEALARSRSDPTRLIAPPTLPPLWRQARNAYLARSTRPIEAVYAAVIAQDPEETNSYLARAAYYAMVDDKPAAIADLNRVIQLKPNAMVHLLRAELYKDIDPAKAIADIKSAQAIEPGSVQAVSLLARIYLLRHDADGAIHEIDAAIPLQEDSANLKQLKAEALVASGKMDEAFQIIDQVVDETPGKSSALNGRCWVKALANADLPGALKDCSAAIEQTEKPAQIYDSRGLVYYRMQRYDEAIADLNAAIRINPAQAESLYIRGLAHLAKGQAADAARDIDDALALEPDVAPYYGLFGVVRPR